MKNNPFFNVLTTIIFIVFLSLSFVGLSLGITSRADNTEWRKLSESPQINSGVKISQFPKNFEAFYKDNFGFRNILLQINATIAYDFFKKSPVVNIIKTDKDWYFHNEPRFIAPNYKFWYDHILFSDKELAGIGDYFLAEKKWLDQKHIPYIFVIVPDKEVIYPEFYPYPDFINANIQLSQILNSLNKRGVPNLFLGPQLVEAKKFTDIPIYIKQDSHWNILGAFFGYQAVMNKIKEYFPNAESLQLSDFNIAVNLTDLPRGYDLHRLKSLIKNPNDSTEPLVDFKIKDNAASRINKIGKAYLYADSFLIGDPSRDNSGGALYFLKYNFDKLIFDRDSLWPPDQAEIEKEKPDIVIREVIQRNLYKYVGPAAAYMH